MPPRESLVVKYEYDADMGMRTLRKYLRRGVDTQITRRLQPNNAVLWCILSTCMTNVDTWRRMRHTHIASADDVESWCNLSEKPRPRCQPSLKRSLSSDNIFGFTSIDQAHEIRRPCDRNQGCRTTRMSRPHAAVGKAGQLRGIRTRTKAVVTITAAGVLHLRALVPRAGAAAEVAAGMRATADMGAVVQMTKVITRKVLPLDLQNHQ